MKDGHHKTALKQYLMKRLHHGGKPHPETSAMTLGEQISGGEEKRIKSQKGGVRTKLKKWFS